MALPGGRGVVGRLRPFAAVCGRFRLERKKPVVCLCHLACSDFEGAKGANICFFIVIVFVPLLMG